MITPSESFEARLINNSHKFKACEAAIDEMLATPPTIERRPAFSSMMSACWVYAVSGDTLGKALAQAYGNVGWRVDYADGTLTFWDGQ